MIQYENQIGQITHLMYFPETPEDEKCLARIETNLPFVKGSEIDKIGECDTRVFRLLPESMTHERDTSVSHLYFR